MFPIQSKTEEWKKSVNHLDKEHSKEFKKVRMSIKKKTDFIVKLRKKAKKEHSPQLNKLIEQATQDLHIKYKVLEEQERQAVRRITTEERSHFCTFAACLKPVVEEEYTMLGEIQQLDEVMDKLSRIIADPHNVPDTSDQVINDMKASGESFCFATPPSSPGGSALGSRRGSLRSLNSVSSSRASSAASIADERESCPLTRNGSFSSHPNVSFFVLFSQLNPRRIHILLDGLSFYKEKKMRKFNEGFETEAGIACNQVGGKISNCARGGSSKFHCFSLA